MFTPCAFCTFAPPCAVDTLYFGRYFGIHVIPAEEAAWFPVTDLRQMHGVKPHTVTALEQTLFGMHPDGSEGFCIRTPAYEEEDEEEEDTTTGEPEDPRSPEEP